MDKEKSGYMNMSRVLYPSQIQESMLIKGKDSMNFSNMFNTSFF